MYDEILLPTDGSEASKAALNHAKQISEKFDSNIHIIYVVDISTMPGDLRGQAHLEQMKEFGEETVKSLEKEMNTTAETKVTVGLPHREIREYVEEKDIDLVTMGSNGRSGLDRILIGSVTEKVLRTCDTPVLVSRETK
ncbi:universal stress protein [Candidatus Nanosalina sp. VS9-1]|uniref:universal stress protein n=1 Tax=Candidatus Nanosalina sp. VS9-1 TaxID=3388566 RepID=UPI0039E02290